MPISFPATLSLPAKVVGSIGTAKTLGECDKSATAAACDIVEIRLDSLAAEGVSIGKSIWSHLVGAPLLFTARRQEEGGSGSFNARQRVDLLRTAMADASMFDCEIASLQEMKECIEEFRSAEIPWIASFHDFEKLPDTAILKQTAATARDAGAAVFKMAARVHSPCDLARLADFQLADHGIPVATMGMGPLAPASRLLCAQSGSILNYGFLGETATAPGQWPAHLLKKALTASQVAAESSIS